MPDGLVWVFQKPITSWDFHVQHSRIRRRKKQLKDGSSVGGNILLRWESEKKNSQTGLSLQESYDNARNRSLQSRKASQDVHHDLGEMSHHIRLHSCQPKNSNLSQQRARTQRNWATGQRVYIVSLCRIVLSCPCQRCISVMRKHLRTWDTQDISLALERSYEPDKTKKKLLIKSPITVNLRFFFRLYYTHTVT